MEDQVKLFTKSLSKNELKDRLNAGGRHMSFRQGHKVLPGVHPSSRGQPAREVGLQYMPAANAKARQNVLLQRSETQPELLHNKPEQKLPFESRNSRPADLLFKFDNPRDQKKLLTRRSASMIWTDSVKIKKSAMVEARDKINQTLQERKNRMSFGHIEDVQQLSDEETPQTSIGQRKSTMGPNNYARTTNFAGIERRDSAFIPNQSTGESMDHGEVILDKMASKRMTLDGGLPRNNSTFLMRLPIQHMANTKSTIEWNEEVGTQLSQFKHHQSTAILPRQNAEIRQRANAQFLKRIESQQVFSKHHPQFSELNNQPYHRGDADKRDMGSTLSQLSSLQMQKIAMGSKTIESSLKGTKWEKDWGKMRTKLGPSAHLYRQQKQVPVKILDKANAGWAVNTSVGTKPILPVHSEAFVDARQTTKALASKFNLEHELRESQVKSTKTKRHGLAQKFKKEMQNTRNFGEYYQNKGQTEHTEEVLRQHFFIAQATGRTLAKDLKRESSPMKHLAHFQAESSSEMDESQKELNAYIQPESQDLITVMKLRNSGKRDQYLEKLQIQTASLMRLNAVWGLEQKPQVVETYMARVDGQIQRDLELGRSIEGVQYDVKVRQDQFVDNLVGKTDLDKIMSLLQSRLDEDGYFLYLKKSETSDPYDLVPLVEHRPHRKTEGKDKRQTGAYSLVDSSMMKEINETKLGEYYTLSKKGITHYINAYPSDFTPLSDWLVERSFYREISVKRFFKNFRTWKQLRMWRRIMLHKSRQDAKSAITEKLFLVDHDFSPILLSHRVSCLEMMKLRVVDMIQKGMNPLSIEEFEERQRTKRDKSQAEIQKKSSECHKMFQRGIDQVLARLRRQVNEQEAMDDTAQRDFISKPEGKHKNPNSKIAENPKFEDLGFSSTLKYGMRKQLRRACSRFIRFSYLLDFLALDALSKIYIGSIEDTAEKLHDLSLAEINFDINPAPVLEESDGDKKQQKNEHSYGSSIIPFFLVEGVFNPKGIRKNKTYEAKIDKFTPTSCLHDFNPTAHMLIEPDVQESSENGADMFESEEDDDYGKVDIIRVRDLYQEQMTYEPGAVRFSDAINDALHEGKSCIGKYIRWSRNEILNKYEAVLESWDDRVAPEWTEPDSPYLDCEEWIAHEALFLDREEIVNRYVRNAFQNVEKFFKAFEPILVSVWENDRTSYDLLEEPRLQHQVEVFHALIKRFYYQKVQFEAQLPVLKEVGMIKIDCSNIRKKLIPQPKEKLDKIKATFLRFMRVRVDAVSEWLEEQTRAIKAPPQDVDSYVRQLQGIEYIDDNFDGQKEIVDVENQKYQVALNEELIGREDKVKHNINRAYSLTVQLNNVLKEAREKSEVRREEMMHSIKQMVPQLDQQTDDLIAELGSADYLNLDPSEENIQEILAKLRDDQAVSAKMDESSLKLYHMRAVLEKVDANKNTMKYLKKSKGDIQEYQQTLDMGTINQFGNVDEAKRNHEFRYKLWHALRDWMEYTNGWMSDIFEKIDTHAIKLLSDKYTKISLQCERNLPAGSSAVTGLKKLVSDFRETMPVVEALGCAVLKDYHWQDIRAIIETVAEIPGDFDLENRQFKLGDLIELDVASVQEEIVKVQQTATQENKLYDEVAEIEAVLKHLDFELDTRPGKKGDDVPILKNVDKTQADIDEQLTRLSVIQGSKFVARLKDTVDSLFDSLMTSSNTVEEWKKCQRNWMYLGKIFGSKEISDAMNREAKEFDQVHRQWSNLMHKVWKNKNVITNCNPDRTKDSKDGQPAKKSRKPQLQANFEKWNEAMDKIRKALDRYLEDKRRDFARFYFISNEELLTLLSEQAKLHEMQKYLGNVFEGIFKLQIDEDVAEIKALESVQGEVVELKKTFKFSESTSFKLWTNLEENMGDTMKKKTKESIRELNDEKKFSTVPFEDWLLNWPGQIIATILLIQWTVNTEIAFYDLFDADEPNPYAMQEFYDDTDKQLKKLVVMIQGDALSPVQRQIFVALISQEVHSRDTLSELVQKINNGDVTSANDFVWQKQLRYYMEEEQGVYIRQVNAQLYYGYEYLGAATRIVVTPLTDRCWLTITGALHIKLGAQPAGPAGTGKTESTKDLAKALGMFCVVYNCTDQVTFKIMGQLFSGIAQSGQWICLDEFNRIDIEVLSVIAQMLQDIKRAKLQKLPEFIFNGGEKPIGLEESCGIFITMNPGYAGRTELPDNLKVLFRPVSMMIPSYALIAQVMLYSEGFTSGDVLSGKMVQLYQLASQQLSQQDHYDFGLRAVKSILVMAGQLKRTEKDMAEDILLIRAMRDANIPKFLADDIPLFNALVQDLFPGLQIENASFVALEQQIAQSTEELKLETNDAFKTKITQLFDTLNVRFGVMLVGPTGGGKTKCYEILQHAMTAMERKLKGGQDRRFGKIDFKVVNPKSISMGELYGEENIDTKEWSDGLASKFIREYAQTDHYTHDPTDNSKVLRQFWCVFDGPVDAKWIENMNTVLDDNMQLSLPNGERIKLHTQMHMVFEAMDMTQASPATVSRLGMVYLTPSDLGWLPYLDSWITRYLRDDKPDPTHRAVPLLPQPDIIEYFREQSVSILIDAFQKLEQIQDEQILPVVPVQAVKNLCNFLETYVFKDCKLAKLKNRDDWEKHLKFIFGYSFIWAFGANYAQSAIRFLDSRMRDIFSSLKIPEADTVFDYHFSQKDQKFTHWKEMLDPYVYEGVKTPFFKLMVPTVDTMRYTHLLEMLTECRSGDDQQSKPVYLTGNTGTGKSLIVQQYIQTHRDEHNLSPIALNFSAQTTSSETQAMLDEKLVKKSTGIYGANGKNKAFIYIDDINMPRKEEYGAQPPIELLRHLVDRGGYYARPDFFWKEIVNFVVVCAAGPPGGGRTALTPRFMRHFHVFNIQDADEQQLTKIFSSILGQFLDKARFDTNIRKNLLAPTVDATIDLYTQITRTLLPIPSKFHYTFNMRDVSKVFQGILMTKPLHIPDGDTFAKLWLHECSRVFADRLCTQEDKEYYQGLACELLGQKFKVKWNNVEEIFGYQKELMFSKVTNLENDADNQNYIYIRQQKDVVKVLEEQLYDYNLVSQSKMDLVFFEDAVQSINKITRILSQRRGNAMLLGVAGCGKQSLTRLSSFMLEQNCFALKMKQAFGPKDFNEQIKEEMLLTGTSETYKTTFLLTDTQITHTEFLEAINSFLNTGEITGLYEKAGGDYDRIEEALGEILEKRKLPANKETCYTAYLEALRDNFHIILCMSPIGDLLRTRALKFPALISCNTLIWFDTWPQEALNEVATQYLGRLTEDELDSHSKKTLAEIFPMIHGCVEETVDTFYNELRRKTYVTPKSYLDGIVLYLRNLEEIRNKAQYKISRLQTGVSNLKATNAQIEDLQGQLTELIPRLLEQNTNAAAQAEQIKLSRQQMAIKKEATEQEKNKMKKDSQILQYEQKLVEKDLNEAQVPMLAAQTIIDKLSKDDITNLKSFKNVTAFKGTKVTMEMVMTYLEEKWDKKGDGWWKQSQKILADINFLARIKQYDKDHIKQSIIDAVGKMKQHEHFSFEKIGKEAAASAVLARWASAIHEYAVKRKIVKPKEEKLRISTETFEKKNAELAAKVAELQAIEAQLVRMQEKLEETVELIKTLDAEKGLSEKRLDNAQKLIDLLGEEGQRWEASVAEMTHGAKFQVGNVFIAASSVSYFGPFTGAYRRDLQSEWIRICGEHNLLVSDGYSLIKTLGDPVEIRNWGMAGLPSDQVSIESGIIVQTSQRWPLIIDPQMQANNWLKRMYRIESRFEDAKEITQEMSHEPGQQQPQQQSGDVQTQWFVVTKIPKQSDSKGYALPTGSDGAKKSQQVIEAAIQYGRTLLLEDVDAAMDPSLDNVFNKTTFMEDGIQKISYGNSPIPYDDGFRLYISSPLANPHFLPETCIKLTVVNFTVTQEGLEDQMLVDVVNNEAPEVEKQRDALVVKIASSRNKLDGYKAKILNELAESDASTILDNEELIATLESTRIASVEIAAELKQSEEVEVQINISRNQYRKVAVRGSILYFCIVDMSGIDPMYQNSLQYVKKLFIEAISKTEEGKESPRARVTVLIDAITEKLYTSVCMGLFERHKLIYSFIICSSINRAAGNINQQLWNLLLRGAGIYDKSKQPKKKCDFISQVNWDLIYCLQTEFAGKKSSKENGFEHPFAHFCQKVEDAGDKWKEYQEQLDDEKIYFDNMPSKMHVKLDAFEKLIIIKLFKPQKLMGAVQKYIKEELGNTYSTSPISTLDQLFAAADKTTPVIFVLSQGVDSSQQVMATAKRNRREIISTSLGKGQEKLATELIMDGQENGKWVLLQNCHLFRTWMKDLDAMCQLMLENQDSIHQNFRLILSSQPVDYFPANILRSGLKMTTEPPRGLKANLTKSYYNTVRPEQYEKSLRPDKPKGRKEAHWSKLVFALCFFHAAIQERRKFGPLGWNIRYEFSESDLDTSLIQLENFLAENEETPWDALKFMTGEITYGGRVTDDWDRVLLMTTLDKYYNEMILLSTKYQFSIVDHYYAPEHSNIDEIRTYIAQLPDKEETEVYGMHSNSEIAYMRAESQLILDNVLSVQPRIVPKKAKKGEEDEEEQKDPLAELVAQLKENIPAPILREDFAASIVKLNNRGLLHCHSTCLLQEVHRYNILIETINTTLDNLAKAAQGLMLMSPDLDEMQQELMNNQVPSLWKAVAYPSLKPIGSWIVDLKERIEFMHDWAKKGHPAAFWLSGFFYPHGFLTGTLQTHSRKRNKPIDALGFTFHIQEQSDKEQLTEAPEDGVLIYGLFILGARWSKINRILVEADPGIMHGCMPVIHFLPEENKNKHNETEQEQEFYTCPVYKTSARAGVLSTTGQSTNFILAVELPCGEREYAQSCTSSQFDDLESKDKYYYGPQPGVQAKHWIMRGTAMLTMLDT